MTRFLYAVPFLALAACVPPDQTIRSFVPTVVDSPCDTPGEVTCVFANLPVKLADTPVRLAGRRADFFPLAAPLLFKDQLGKIWAAPERTLTDGASIPSIFIPVVGDPRDPSFALAATLHDAYCGIGNEDGSVYHSERWQDVHLMFHDTLISAGVEPIRAKVMFAAVWLGGPRWSEPRRDLIGVPTEALVAALRDTIRWIERENPPLQDIVVFLEEKEQSSLSAARMAANAPASDPIEKKEEPDRDSATVEQK